MEALRQRIAESARKAGLDSEFDALDRVVRVSSHVRISARRSTRFLSPLEVPTPRLIGPFFFSLNSQRDAPPECEWWDEPLLPTKAYDDLTKIESEDSPITIYVQHPVQIAAPWEKKKVEIRPLMLTKKVRFISADLASVCGSRVEDWSRKRSLTRFPSFFFSRPSQEAKKMRKQRRMADLKDRQDRVRMGLIPPDAPKGEFSSSSNVDLSLRSSSR